MERSQGEGGDTGREKNRVKEEIFREEDESE